MEVRHLSNRFSTCRNTSILHLLIPSLRPLAWSSRPRPQRSLTTSTHLRDDRSPPPQRSNGSDFAQAFNSNPSMMDLLDETFEGSRKSSSKSQKSSQSSADLLENPFEEEIHRPEEESRANRQGSMVRRMNMPENTTGDAVRRASEGVSRQMKVPVVARNTATIKSRPSLGRTVYVTDDGVARALQTLAREVRDNNVRVDQKMQRFHERPGLKRKRLKSERWRKRFMIAFKATVQKVQEMRKKGW